MSPQSNVSFSGMVGSLMDLFKSKDHYRQLSAGEDDTGSRVVLGAVSSFRDTEEGRGLLGDDNVEVQTGPKRASRGCSCCVLFCKAFGIVFGLLSLYAAFRLIRWALTDPPSALAGMPVFSRSLGCTDTPYLYNNTQFTINVPLGRRMDHALDILGGGVGTIVIAEAPSDATEMTYKISIKSDDEAFLNQVAFLNPSREDTSANSRFIIRTPQAGVDEKQCSRFEVTAYVPKNLKTLALSSHTTTHVQFHPEAKIQTERLSVTLYKMSTLNMILPHPRILADKLSLEVFRGWIVGDVAILNSTAISTQRGDGIMNVRVIPTTSNQLHPAFIQTTTGAGRTDFFYINEQYSQHRPIRAVHMSSRNADMYIHYDRAQFDGTVEIKSKSYTTRGLETILPEMLPDIPNPGSGKPPAWTHSHGNLKGGDRMMSQSRGWTGLYF